MKSQVIAVDFDGTIVMHEFPKLGAPVPGALETLHRLQRSGHKIILWTCRSGKYLEEAKAYLLSAGIELFGVNENPEQKGWWSWKPSRKAHANLFIDDKSLGCPLLCGPYKTDNPCVDWRLVSEQLALWGWI